MWLPVTESLNTAFETYNPSLNICFFRRLIHQSPDTVVSDEVHQYLFPDHLRRQAAQDIQSHCYLDVTEKQLDIPAFKVQFGKLLCRIPRYIKQGGDDVKPLSSEATIFYPDLNLS